MAVVAEDVESQQPSIAGPRRALGGFGRAVGSSSVYLAPRGLDELPGILEQARQARVPLALRGAGRSYGDASLNGAGLVVGTEHLDRIISWNAGSGVVEMEPGVTIEQLWKHTLEDGYWPAVVPGTMFPTMGGCVAMNIHGKNHFKVGPFGDHVEEIELLLPQGGRVRASREERGDLFRAAIGGFGMLGILTRVKLRLRRISTGKVRVEALSTRNLDHLFEAFDARLSSSDYLVGWIDAFAKGSALGRAVIHKANYVEAHEDPEGAASLKLSAQGLPDRFFGVIPRPLMWRLFAPFVNDLGMPLINTAKFVASRLLDRPDKPYLQGLVAFQFLLDYVPRWREAYGKNAFIQVQPFVPAANARAAFQSILELCQRRGIVPYLAVFKKHRPDEFLLSHALDGYSMALDIRVTPATREAVWALGQDIEDIVVEAGGRIYFAKDAVARADQVAASFGAERVQAFEALKREVDPEGILSTELSRRVLPSLPVIGAR